VLEKDIGSMRGGSTATEKKLSTQLAPVRVFPSKHKYNFH
jgi:hypothetical protein